MKSAKKSANKPGTKSTATTARPTDGDGLAKVITNSRIVVTCGSGGVGKTTTAAAIGIGAAMESDRRVLVITIDPAKRLADAFGLAEIDNVERQVTLDGLTGELFVAMLDTSQSWDALVNRHAPDTATARRILANPLYRNITQRFVQSHDYIAMERVFDLDAQGLYDLIVIDTPPSRHALDFLDAPQRMAEFFSSALLKWITLPYRTFGERAGKLGYLAAKPFYQVADRILGSQFLEDIAEFFLLFQGMYDGFVQRADSVTRLIHDRSTSFVVVATPEPSPLHEAEFFLRELAHRNLRLGALVLNQVLPDMFVDPAARESTSRLLREAADGEIDVRSTDVRLAVDIARSFDRYGALADRQRIAITRLAQMPETTVTVPVLATVHHGEALRSITAALWAKPDPSKAARIRSTRAAVKR